MGEPANDIEQLQQTVKQLTAELNNLKDIVAHPTPISADAYAPLLTNPTINHQVLDIPLTKVIDLYQECPQILEVIATRVAM